MKDFGIRTDNLKTSLFPYFLLTIIMYMFIWLYSFFIPDIKPLIKLWNSLYPIAVLVIPLSILQELFFRGFLMNVFKKRIKSPYNVIVINSLIFTAAHVVFPYPHIILPGAFITGLLFAITYYYYPNLILASLSHILVNYAIVPYCYFKLIHC